jgi:hypothetical protein
MASWTGLLTSLPTTPMATPIQMSTGPQNTRLATPTVMPEYKMQGWYSSGSVYETWTAYAYPNTTPPSGHTLTGITYVRIA